MDNPIEALERLINSKRQELVSHEHALAVLKSAYGSSFDTRSVLETPRTPPFLSAVQDRSETLIQSVKGVIRDLPNTSSFTVKDVVIALKKIGLATELKNPQARIGQIVSKLASEAIGFLVIIHKGGGSDPYLYALKSETPSVTAEGVSLSNPNASAGA